jgi:hypothetical protein
MEKVLGHLINRCSGPRRIKYLTAAGQARSAHERCHAVLDGRVRPLNSTVLRHSFMAMQRGPSPTVLPGFQSPQLAA